MRLKPVKRVLRNMGFVLDDYVTYVDKKELSFRHPYIYFFMFVCSIGIIWANKHYGFGLY